MNREKKQILVVAVLFILILAVGAFQMMGGSKEAPAPEAKKPDTKVAAAKEGEAAALPNPEFHPLPERDPFMPAPFMTAGTDQDKTVVPPPTTAPVAKTASGPKLNPLPRGDFQTGGKEPIPPMPVPDKPEFGYTLIGLVEGAHPAAVFEDAQGNQQLVEVGQGIGSSATITNISRGQVRVKFNAETLVFNVGGNPNAK